MTIASGASRPATQLPERHRVLGGRIIGRVEKDYFVAFLIAFLPCTSFSDYFAAFPLNFTAFALFRFSSGAAQKRTHAAAMNAESGSNSQPGKVGAQDAERRRRALDKLHPGCPTAERLDSHRARSGIQIQKGRASNPRRQYIEEGLAQTVAGGPGGQPRRGLKRTGTKLSGNDSHHHQHTGAEATTIDVCEAGRYRWAVGWALSCAFMHFFRF
jgi:hypothetical protein